MAMKGKIYLNPFAKPMFLVKEDISEEEEEGGEYLFDPEAGKASDDPFAHLASKDTPDESAVSEETVSKYVAGEQE